MLGLIPARGGSVRFKKKNLATFDLHRNAATKIYHAPLPLVTWAVISAHTHRAIDRIAVSTDDPEIARLAGMPEFPAEIIDRPAHLATAEADMLGVLRHALTIIPAEVVVLLQPTSPLRGWQDIDQCLAPVLAGHTSAAFTVCPKPHPCGSVYVWARAAIESGILYPKDAAMIEVPARRAVDIDRPLDLEIAREFLRCG